MSTTRPANRQSVSDALLVEWLVAAVREIAKAELERRAIQKHAEQCGSGWTGDRCTFPLFHDGEHSNA